MDSAFPSLLRRSSINWGGVELLLSFFGGYSGFTMATVMMYLPYYVIIYPGISNRFYLKRRPPPPPPSSPWVVDIGTTPPQIYHKETRLFIAYVADALAPSLVDAVPSLSSQIIIMVVFASSSRYV